jgi:hypothetical protein
MWPYDQGRLSRQAGRLLGRNRNIFFVWLLSFALYLLIMAKSFPSCLAITDRKYVEHTTYNDLNEYPTLIDCLRDCL